MDTLLITPEEILELAFSPVDQIDPQVLTHSRIEAARLKFLVPVFGELCSLLGTERFAYLLNGFVKPALAFFVKYAILQELAVRIGNDGITQIGLPDQQPAEPALVESLRRDSLHAGHLFLRRGLEYLRRHESEFPELKMKRYRRVRREMHGGILL